MAIRHIREAFDHEADGHATCSKAFLHYESDGNGGQHQIITIEGVTSAGEAFKLATPPHAMSDDPHIHARKLAQSLKPDEPAGKVAGEPSTAGSH